MLTPEPDSSSHHILIAGFGDIGAAVARALAGLGAQVTVLSRRERKNETGIQHVACDISDAGALSIALAASDASFALLCLSPDSFTEAAYEAVFVQGVKNFLHACPATMRQLFFVSSTSVYGQLQGEWVDENSPIEPAGFSGKSLYLAESLLRDSDVPSVAVRFAGIYGRGSNRLLQKALRGEYSGSTTGDSPYTNRIHREDCVAVLVFLLQRAFQGAALNECYLAADNTPVTQADLQAWLQAEYTRCHGALPGPVDVAQRDLTAANNSPTRRAGSKRCSNKRLRDAGYEFLYSDYRAGYGEIIAAMDVGGAGAI